MQTPQTPFSSIEDLIEGMDLPTLPPEGSPEWILDMAFDAATSAAQRAHEACDDHSDCGGAWVVIDDGRSAFARFLKQSGMGDRHYEGGWRLSLCQGLRVQSRIIFEEACHAFVEVMEQHGIKAWVYSYMD
ncbi:MULTISPECIES: hypothetical protein [unclassified Pseudovibrio]|uniref:hypothetical protein n=1 Tax=unclassified Pseudovibrio TaxID=2627060 RepID=UPI0007AEAA3C|nr:MULTISPECIES: hypothetical protein [unclassified Pseudovibrio]KZK92528.1 hypothetical protein PsW74_05455 [Pseudovibrio sp. W74]KZL03185.1 hypothetical protein PsAD14_05715 [Pseudovibrio sp. Ad14]